ncbi:hypothetical protein EW146_g6419 [Bondarzewia mesenterica]|uniref:Uncharacterized protein n=1 Tax=Bondarzewia mesenterica TaxID=1095465 RepID=A0A4V6S1E2_9AGAM|nr:hypothetical protein EW146_g6419 [Bondarzewia mesenterica]
MIILSPDSIMQSLAFNPKKFEIALNDDLTSLSVSKPSSSSHTISNPASPSANIDSSIAAINRLPVEILSHIFIALVRHLSDPGMDDLQEGQRAVLVSHTCAHWRNIALSCPFLWTTVDTRLHPALRGLFIERSATLPMRLNVTRLDGDDFLHIISQQLSRLREVHTNRDFPHARILELMELLAQSAPMLEVLELECDWYKHRGPLSPHDLVLDRSAPLLKALYLDCFYPPSVTSLTHLTLRCCFYDRPDVARLLNFLEQNPRLEVLHIVATDDMWLGVQDPGSHRPVVRLEHLRSVSFKSCLESFIRILLTYLVFPATTLVRLESDEVDDFLRGARSLFPRDASPLRFLHTPKFLQIQQTSSDFQYLGGDETTAFSVKLRALDDGFILRRSFISLLSWRMTDCVQELWLGPKLEFRGALKDWLIVGEQWRQIFLGFPALRVLSLPVEAGNSMHVLDALTPVDGDAQAMLCPNLTTLHIYRITTQPSDSFDALSRFVSARARHGHPIHHLHFHVSERFGPEHRQWCALPEDEEAITESRDQGQRRCAHEVTWDADLECVPTAFAVVKSRLEAGEKHDDDPEWYLV